MKSSLPRALLVALIVAVPSMAAIPPSVTVRLGGAEELELYHFQVRAGDLISMSATASPGDSMWVIAAPIELTGEIDYSKAIRLISERRSATGTVAADFKIPKELTGMSFAIVAFGRDSAGQIDQSTEVRVDVLPQVEDKPAK